MMISGDVIGWIIAFATIATVIATIATALAAWRQLSQVKAARWQKIWATVAAVERYDTDPVIDAYCQRLWDASDDGTNYKKPEINKRDIIGLLNFFNGIATGCKQGVYVESIVKDNLQLPIKKAVEKFIRGGIIDEEGYGPLLELYEDWFKKKTEVGFKA